MQVPEQRNKKYLMNVVKSVFINNVDFYWLVMMKWSLKNTSSKILNYLSQFQHLSVQNIIDDLQCLCDHVTTRLLSAGWQVKRKRVLKKEKVHLMVKYQPTKSKHVLPFFPSNVSIPLHQLVLYVFVHLSIDEKCLPYKNQVSSLE